MLEKAERRDSLARCARPYDTFHVACKTSSSPSSAPADHTAQAMKHAAQVTPTARTISGLKYERMGHGERHDSE